MYIRNTAVSTLVSNFQRDLDRASDLHDALVLNGYAYNSNQGKPTRLRHPDQRDIAQFIFFEVAAKFEGFAMLAFQIEVRERFGVTIERSKYIMGSADRGLVGATGWGAPSQLKSRGKHLHGKLGLFANLDTILGSVDYQRLILAHIVRNRIAHDGQKSKEKFNEVLRQLNVPTASRKGISVGRVLRDYPINVAQTDKWFYRFVNAYRSCSVAVQDNL